MSRKETLTVSLLEWPHDPDRRQGAAVMRDHQHVRPGRIAVDAALDARRLGAEVAACRAVAALTQEADGGRFATIGGQGPAGTRDRRDAGEHGRHLDRRGGRAGPGPGRGVSATPTGIHVALSLPHRCGDRTAVNSPGDHEPIFRAPFEAVYDIGPPEVNWAGAPDDIAPTEDEIAPMVHEAHRVLPGMVITRTEVLLARAGVRPLTFGRSALPMGNRLRILHDLSEDGRRHAAALTGRAINPATLSGHHRTFPRR